VRRPWDTTRAGLVGFSILAAGGTSVHAAQWSIAPILGLWVDYDTNRSLVPQSTPSYGTAMTLDMPLQYASERLKLSLHPQAILERFSNHEFANANDVIVSGEADWLTERSSWSLTSLFSDQNLTTTELPNTGVVYPGTRRRDSQAGLSWTYAQSEKLSLTLQGNYEHAIYSSDGTAASTVALQSYRYSSYSASEQLQHSDRLAGFVTLSASEFLQEGIPSPARTYGAVVGFKSQLSERNTLTADVGASRTKLEGLVSNGLLYDLTFIRTTTTGNFSLSASRNVSPVGSGELTEQEALKVSLQRDLKERLALNAALSANRYSGVFSVPDFIADIRNLDRTYAQTSIGLVYRTSETWSVGVRGFYNWLNSKTVPTADGWAVRLEAVWAPSPHSVSR
jgi:hypothetical protein